MKHERESGAAACPNVRAHLAELAAGILREQGAAELDRWLPYPTDAGVGEFLAALQLRWEFSNSIRSNHARRALVDARASGRVRGFPANAHIYLVVNKPEGYMCMRHTPKHCASGKWHALY